MHTMAPTVEDRWLWLGLGSVPPPLQTVTTNLRAGVFTFIAIKGVSHGLRNVVHLTEVHKPPPQSSDRLPTRNPAADAEDAIKPSSLQTLATCSNVEIRKAATKILCERFIAHPSALRTLEKDLQSRNEAVQRRAQLACNLLYDFDVLPHEIAPPPTPVRRPQRLVRVVGSHARTGVNRDPEERDLRRRRREAMVLNEGDRPVSQQDVWMRDGEGRMNIEEHIRPMSTLQALTGELDDG